MDQIHDTSDSVQPAAAASSFSEAPWSWHYACELRDVVHGPVGVSIGAREFVLFADGPNHVVAMDRRCVHMGADLARGCAGKGRIRCPFHQWEFNQQGKCVHIPASDTIPAFARQQVYPTAVVGPHVLLFNRTERLFDAPFFDGVAPGDLLAAKPFEFEVEMPWYMVGANGFDVQHFRAAHDRTLVGEPVITRPSPFAYRIVATFDVAGDSLRDRLTRVFSGPRVTMTVTSWCGTLVFVTAKFERTVTYGMVCVRPIDRMRSYVRVIVWIAKPSGLLGMRGFLDVAIRRGFIRAFLSPDIEAGAGIRYSAQHTIPADDILNAYLQWLAGVQGEPRLSSI